MNAAEILARFGDLRVLVLGDICLDRWCWYDPAVAEKSAETGIPRTGVIRTVVTAGAGGTVANNLAALGVGKVSVLGMVGEDGFAWELQRALKSRGICGDLLIPHSGLCTFTYTKLINCATDEEDLPRVDFINTQPMPVDAERSLIAALEGAWSSVDVVMVSDQAETENGGVVTAVVRKRVLELAAQEPSKLVWVDSRKRPELFRGVAIKPNRDEAEEACRRLFGTVDFARLARESDARPLIVTHGERGALVIDGRDGVEQWAPTRRVTPVDICGAGDSFSAGAASALACGASTLEAARFGNIVASITVTKKGTGTSSPAEVIAASVDVP